MIARTSFGSFAKGLANPSRVFIDLELLVFVADEFDDGHFCAITDTATKLDDAQIAAGTIRKAIR